MKPLCFLLIYLPRLDFDADLLNLAVYAYERGSYAEAECYFRRALAAARDEPLGGPCAGLCNSEVFRDVLAKQGKKDLLRALDSAPGKPG